jgi:phage tail-like protein
MEANPAVTNKPSLKPSSLLDYLPAIYRQDTFVGLFLLAFEKVLLGRKEEISKQDSEDLKALKLLKGLEETIAELHRYFSPVSTSHSPEPPNDAPAEFLPWLARWTAFNLRAGLSDDQQRKFLAKVIQNYHWRGTNKGMVELLGVFTAGTPVVTDVTDDPQEPYRFRVRITVNVAAQDQQRYGEFIQQQRAIAHAVIEFDKPAHTVFKTDDLQLIFPSLIIGEAEIGEKTLISTRTN